MTLMGGAVDPPTCYPKMFILSLVHGTPFLAPYTVNLGLSSSYIPPVGS